MTVFRSGILDFSFLLLMMTLSWTNQGEISSKLLLALSFEWFVMVFILDTPLDVFDWIPLVMDCLLSLLLTLLVLLSFPLIRLLTVFRLLLRELDLERLFAKRGSLEGFLPTLERDRVTGWLLANEVSILLRMEEASAGDGSKDLGWIWDGSSDPSGEALGEVDMGDPSLDPLD